MTTIQSTIQLRKPPPAGCEDVLNAGALDFLAALARRFEPRRRELLERRRLRQAELDAGSLPDFLPETKGYALAPTTATLVVRPRGWHLVEKHVDVDGAPISASLFDFGLAFYHNAAALIAKGSGPYFYLPKLESHLEARAWNDVFIFAQEALGIPRGTIRATVLIETILAAFETDEIPWELRDHSSGLNCGRWDYIFR